MPASGRTLLRHLGAFLFILGALVSTVPSLKEIAFHSYDEIYQLALGLKVLHGAWPGLDFFTNYGPGVAVLSTPSWFFANPILAELAFGYVLSALGLWALWACAGQPGRLAHNLVLLLMLSCTTLVAAKYYYVLWPGLLLLTLGDPALERTPARERLHWLVLGLLVGLGGWFRLEIGLALGAGLAGVLAWRARACRHAPRRLATLAVVALSGALAPWVLYFASAAVVRGTVAGPFDLLDFYVISTFAKASDFNAVFEVKVALGYFRIATLALYLLLLCVLASLAMLITGWSTRAVAPGRTPALRRAWCAAWFFLCLSPQALHRIDWVHFIQILPCGLVALVLALAVWSETADAGKTRFWSRLALASLLLPAALGFTFHHKRACHSLTVTERLQGITRGLPSLNPDEPQMQLAALVRQVARTEGGGTVLVPSIDTRIQVLAGLPFAGIVPHWSYGLPERWQLRQIDALRRDPAAVLVMADYFRAPEASPDLRKLDFLGRNPLIDAYVFTVYPRLVAQNPHWRILAPATTP